MRKTDHIYARLMIFTIGLLIMALGIVLMIRSDLGASPWDVLHVGLYYQFGLSVGSWSILVGFLILGSAAIMLKEWPQFGAYLNMLLVGVFIDMYMAMPFIQQPSSWPGKTAMFLVGMLVYSYGMGIYLSARLGAGPRDSFMLALVKKAGWPVAKSRRVMEVIVLLVGWALGGPVFIGTVIFSLAAGTCIGFALPQCEKWTERWMKRGEEGNEIERGAS